MLLSYHWQHILLGAQRILSSQCDTCTSKVALLWAVFCPIRQCHLRTIFSIIRKSKHFIYRRRRWRDTPLGRITPVVNASFEQASNEVCLHVSWNHLMRWQRRSILRVAITQNSRCGMGEGYSSQRHFCLGAAHGVRQAWGYYPIYVVNTWACAVNG